MEINKPVTTIILLIINLILIFLFVIPKYHESQLSELDLVQKQLEYDNRYKYYSELLRVIKDIEKRQDSLSKIERALPDDFSISPIVYFLQKKAKENQLIFKSVTFSKTTSQIGQRSAVISEKGVKSVKIEVNLSGTYNSLKGLLNQLDKSDRLFEVDNISFLVPEVYAGSVLPNGIRAYDFKLQISTNTY